jgi:sporulation protein YlmC with PRC-barrel domain
MLRSLKELLGYELMATDGQIGNVEDLLLSDEDWRIRYLVVDTGPWIFGRKVLISPEALLQPVWASKTFPVNLTREQVKSSPDVDLAKPVSRQYEEKLRTYYNWPVYWGGTHPMHGGPTYVPPNLFKTRVPPEDATYDTHLRSAHELLDYQILATDGEVGTMDDFIVEDEDWQFRYLVLDTSEETGAEKKVLIALEWVSSIEVEGKDIFIGLTREAIRFSPEFDPTVPVNRQYEEVLYDYHGRPKYWQVVK